VIILLHSSKTMRLSPVQDVQLSQPQLLPKTEALASYLQTLSQEQLAKVMHLSPALAEKTQKVIAAWNVEPERQSWAIDSFIGDIYSGLQIPSFSAADHEYANQVLRILSGLYGILRPADGIYPYRLEMGYRLPDPTYASLYTYWGDAIAATLPTDGPIINLAAVEYSQTVTAYVDASRMVAPRFLTINPKTGEPGFVVVHAKIARGAFARWLIVNRVEDVAFLRAFDDLGYVFAPELSTHDSPTFVCQEFGGKGLSLRLR
jgi:cytoplasmic iron level regulating protein YaaA (DUF328/UPF0246 family)